MKHKKLTEEFYNESKPRIQRYRGNRLSFPEIGVLMGCSGETCRRIFDTESWAAYEAKKAAKFMREPEIAGLSQEIAAVLNKYCAENDSNTPDFILAEYLAGALNAFNMAVSKRDAWYGVRLPITEVGS